jgi:rubredoxin
MMAKFKCSMCGYIYVPTAGDEERDIEPGTPFEDLPEEWRCPYCGSPQDKFHKYEPVCRT